MLHDSAPPLPPAYTYEGPLGSGTHGVVYKVRHRVLDRSAALKRFRTEHAGTEARARFNEEGLSLARLDHPAIARILDAGEDREGPYLVMEYIEGPTLREFLKAHGPLPVEDAIALGATLADGLAAVHEVLPGHRDVKPSNILLREGQAARPVLIGFGLARADPLTSMTPEFVETLLYASPERWRNGTLDARSDLYSLCAVLYECLTGGPPVGGGEEGPPDLPRMIRQVFEEELPALHDLRPEVPEEVSQVIMRGLARDPEDRYQTADQLADALRASLAGTVAVSASELPRDDEPLPVSEASPLPPEASPVVGEASSQAEEAPEDLPKDRVDEPYVILPSVRVPVTPKVAEPPEAPVEPPSPPDRPRPEQQRAAPIQNRRSIRFDDGGRAKEAERRGAAEDPAEKEESWGAAVGLGSESGGISRRDIAIAAFFVVVVLGLVWLTFGPDRGKESPYLTGHMSGVGLVTAAEPSAGVVMIDIDGEAHTFAAVEGVTIPPDISPGDSVAFSVRGGRLTSLTKLGASEDGPAALAIPPAQNASSAEEASPEEEEVPPVEEPEPEPVADEETARADLSGSWLMCNTVENVSLSQYRGLRLCYEVAFEQNGTRLFGRGVKSTENGETLAGNRRTPIEIEGEVAGSRASVSFTERGGQRTSTGNAVWLRGSDGSWSGTFSSTAASSSGPSRLRRSS